MKKNKQLYVVIARRWGESESHAYLIGVFGNETRARSIAKQHTQYRGGKYACVVEKCELNGFKTSENGPYPKETFRTKSIMEELL